MKNSIILFSWKDLSYPSDRDGWVSFFEKYLDFLISQWKKVHYITSIGYSWWEEVEDKRKFQLNEIKKKQKWNLYIHRINISWDIDYIKYKNAKNKFEKRLIISNAEANSIDKLWLDIDKIICIHIFHVSHAVGVILKKTFSNRKIVLHPMMTGMWYRKYTKVPDSYINAEKYAFEKVWLIHTPSLEEKNWFRIIIE